MVNNEATINEFWNYVHELEWGDGIKSAAVIKAAGLKRLPPYKADKFKELARTYATNLNRVMEGFDVKRYSTWHRWVACFEVIGYGRAEYERTMLNPHEIERVVEVVEFADSDQLFINALPSEDDYFACTE